MSLFRKRRGGDQDSIVIDLREPAPTRLQWGSPMPCPDCAGRGYLDHIDPYKDIMYLHCTQCGVKYSVAKADLDAVTA